MTSVEPAGGTLAEALVPWRHDRVTIHGQTRDVYRRDPVSAGRRPSAVIVLHELPGLSPAVVAFADDLVAAGHTVLVPRLFGPTPEGRTLGTLAEDVVNFCVRREFSVFARGRTSPVVEWLRELARRLDAEFGGRGVGVVGLCFTGGFALAMVADAPVVAPVLGEPSLPLPLLGTERGRALRGADLGLSPIDLSAAKQADIDVLGLRYRCDRFVGTRFATLEAELGERFFAIEFDSADADDHSVLTSDQQPVALGAVLDFFDDKLKRRRRARRWRRAVGVHPDGR
jgi:dienelactone hydrolase